jgi:predicted YcjX-like family ATPase
MDINRNIEKLGAAMAHNLNRRTDIAVTGLRRSGKTIFIASLVHNLKTFHQTGALPAFLPGPQISGVEERPDRAGDVNIFPTKDYVQAIMAEEPAWPAPTSAVSRTDLYFRVKRSGITAFGPFGQKIVHVGIIDYPGEWLLDLPMLEQDFARWSLDTLQLLRSEPRQPLARQFLDFLATTDPDSPADDDHLRRGHGLYRDVLHACRDQLHLSFLQPGRFVMPDGKGDRPLLWFFPLEVAPDAKESKGSTAAMLRKRYDNYCQKIVRPFFQDTFARTNRQVVLVDLLAALNGGRHVFDDTQRAIDAAMDALQPRRTGILSRLLPRRFDRVLFAVTKADHVPELQRDRLRDLLMDMTGDRVGAASVAGAEVKTIQIASVRATEDTKVTRDIGEVDVVSGIPVGQKTRVMARAGRIPRLPLPSNFWDGRDINYPRFSPPAQVPGRPIPSINLDVVLNFLLGDLLT